MRRAAHPASARPHVGRLPSRRARELSPAIGSSSRHCLNHVALNSFPSQLFFMEKSRIQTPRHFRSLERVPLCGDRADLAGRQIHGQNHGELRRSAEPVVKRVGQSYQLPRSRAGGAAEQTDLSQFRDAQPLVT